MWPKHVSNIQVYQLQTFALHNVHSFPIYMGTVTKTNAPSPAINSAFTMFIMLSFRRSRFAEVSIQGFVAGLLCYAKCKRSRIRVKSTISTFRSAQGDSLDTV